MPAMVYESNGDEERREVQTIERRAAGTLLASQLENKAIVDIHSGEKIGNITEVLFDPDRLQVAALLFSTGGLDNLFNRGGQAISGDRVRVWGKDVLLVEQAEILNEAEIPARDRLVKLSEKLRGRPVVSTDGKRIGQVNDLILDQQGRVTAYDLSQVDIEGPLQDTRQLPAEATYSLGEDVLLVDMSKLP